MSAAQSWVFNGWTETHATVALPLVLGMMLVNIAVFVWQAVGVVRASDHWVRGRGSLSNTWGAQLGIILAAMLVMADSWGFWVLTVPVEDTAALSRELAREYSSSYSIGLSGDGQVIQFVGEIRSGSSKALAVFIADYPDAKTMSITSEGGNIYEARGLAKLISDNNLNTQARETCNSACTIVFISGAERELETGTLLGFHQYSIDARFATPLVKPREEEARDRELFRKAGVADWFLERMFDERADGIWYPAKEDLQKAGILTMNQRD